MRARLLARWRGEGSTVLEVAPPDCPGANIGQAIGAQNRSSPLVAPRLAHRSRPSLPRALSRTAAVTRRRGNTNRNTRHRRQDDGGQGGDPDRPRGVTPNGTSEFV